MSDRRTNNRLSRKKILLISMMLLGIAVIAFLFLQYPQDNNVDEMVSATGSEVPTATHRQAKEYLDHQKAATPEVMQGKPVTGPITDRPDYVSEFEWQVLRNIAKLNPDGQDKQLADLVNKLLFNKKMEAWLAAKENSGDRKTLAKQLLDMIPDQVATESLDSATAKDIESKLSAELASY